MSATPALFAALASAASIVASLALCHRGAAAGAAAKPGRERLRTGIGFTPRHPLVAGDRYCCLSSHRDMSLS